MKKFFLFFLSIFYTISAWSMGGKIDTVNNESRIFVKNYTIKKNINESELNDINIHQVLSSLFEWQRLNTTFKKFYLIENANTINDCEKKCFHANSLNFMSNISGIATTLESVINHNNHLQLEIGPFFYHSEWITPILPEEGIPTIQPILFSYSNTNKNWHMGEMMGINFQYDSWKFSFKRYYNINHVDFYQHFQNQNVFFLSKEIKF